MPMDSEDDKKLVEDTTNPVNQDDTPISDLENESKSFLSYYCIQLTMKYLLQPLSKWTRQVGRMVCT